MKFKDTVNFSVFIDDANALLKNVQEVEATVNTSKSAAESAEKSANTAKSIGEAVFKNITTLIQVL